jgi:hypothetical protein
MLYVASDQLVDALEHDDLPLFVESAGYILGGAASCSNIDRTRILVATDRVKEISEVSEASKTTAHLCDIALRDGLAAGAKAVGSGKLDRAQAAAALAILERMIGR